TQERSFRAAAAELDSLLSAASQDLSGQGLSVVDASARSYHYKNEFLMWSTRLSAEWVLGYERALITVVLTCCEPVEALDATKVTARTVAEIFQTGQFSRVREVHESDVPWERLRNEGLATVVRG